MIKAAAWTQPPEPMSVFQAGVARLAGDAWDPPGTTGAPREPAAGGAAGTPGSGPAAIVTISDEARAAAEANMPAPVLLGQHQRTAADNLPRLPGGMARAGAEDGTGAEGASQGVDAPRAAGWKPGVQDARKDGASEQAKTGGAADRPDGAKSEDGAADGPDGPDEELSAEEQQMVQELKARDREVRAHEAAHLAAAGGISKGGASFTYQSGPDGRRYAVGGEVQIDTSAEDDPRATVAKARQIQAAANAPAEPSGQDRAVAAAAAQMAAEAQAELAKQGQEETAKAANGGKEGEKDEEGQPPNSAATGSPRETGEPEGAASESRHPGPPDVSGKPPGARSEEPAASRAGARPADDRNSQGSAAEPPRSAASSPGLAAPAGGPAPYRDPHDHPDPSTCEPCSRLASTRVAEYA